MHVYNDKFIDNNYRLFSYSDEELSVIINVVTKHNSIRIKIKEYIIIRA